MSAFFIFFLTSILLNVCVFTVFLILMQRPSEESGIGATLGGGVATSVFGGEAVNVLAKITKYCVIVFFALSFILSMLYLSLEKTDKPQNLLEKREIDTAKQSAAAVVTEKVQSGENAVATSSDLDENFAISSAENLSPDENVNIISSHESGMPEVEDENWNGEVLSKENEFASVDEIQ